MTITNFDHVESELIRDLCNGDVVPHSGYLAYAIGYIGKMAELDATHNDISIELANERMLNSIRATNAFNNNEFPDCLDAIRAFWSN